MGMCKFTQRKSVKWKDGQGQNSGTHQYLKSEVRKSTQNQEEIIREVG